MANESLANEILARTRGEQDAENQRAQAMLDRAIWFAMTPMQRECLAQLFTKGPVWDGDVCSKHARGELFDLGMASRAIVKGEYGFTVANYRGAAVYKAGQD